MKVDTREADQLEVIRTVKVLIEVDKVGHADLLVAAFGGDPEGETIVLPNGEVMRGYVRHHVFVPYGDEDMVEIELEEVLE
jgi:hypothetical protein